MSVTCYFCSVFCNHDTSAFFIFFVYDVAKTNRAVPTLVVSGLCEAWFHYAVRVLCVSVCACLHELMLPRETVARVCTVRGFFFPKNLYVRRLNATPKPEVPKPVPRDRKAQLFANVPVRLMHFYFLCYMFAH